MIKCNTLIFIFSALLSSTQLISVAEAKEKGSRKSTPVQEENPIVYRRSEPEGSAHSQRVALGFSTFQSGLPSGAFYLNGTSLTGIFEFSRTDLVQIFLAIPTTSPFNIGGSAFLKHTLVEHQTSGFHVGAGIGMANINGSGGVSGPNLAMSFSAIGGFHFEMPGVPHVLVHLDGGATFYFVNTSPNNSTNSFNLNALSPALGASVLYAF
jgi:hypothetical protein